MGKSNKEYICVEKNEKGEIENAIYYSRQCGRGRLYRQSYPKPAYSGLVLLKYKLKKNAQETCDYTNKEFGNHYEVKEIDITQQ